jgi:DNA-binding transcriptional regulator YiaG
MDADFRQFVQLVNANLSEAKTTGKRYCVDMSASHEASFNEAYCLRVKTLRERRGFTAEKMAIALGIPADRYRKYEVRSPLPPYLIEQFSIIAETSIEFVLTGKSSRHRPDPASNAHQPSTISKLRIV